MSVDRSLKNRNMLSRHRNVLTRAERVEALEDEGRWQEESGSVFGLPKVTHRKSLVGKKAKKVGAEADDAAEDTASTENQTASS